MAELVPLDKLHERDRFDCGSPELNSFIRSTARQHQDKGLSRTSVLVNLEADDPHRILGYFSLTAYQAASEDLPDSLRRKLPRTIPAILLGRLAVDQAFQSQGYGGSLLVEAMRRVAQTASLVGVAGLFVDAKDERAAQFYSHFGFVALRSNPLKLYLPIGTLISFVESDASS
ncbi:MAG: GNAT family N-acetyltransferase [Planctomycetaceae bacterium]|nr:GNAT family N-acetyltransferase [Planctomycetaceae bacterium]